MPDPRPWWLRAVRYLTLWTVVAAFFAIQVRLDYAYLGQQIGWLEAFALALAEWYAWALLSPLLWWLARRFPFERDRWLKAVLVHLPASLFITLVKVLIEFGFVGLTNIPFRPPQMADLNASLLTAWLIIGVCQALLHYRSAQERRARALDLESRLARARLDLLRAQLQPHFLFNTLHAVTTLMHRDVHAAESMLTRLADLLRLSLDLRDRQEVTLREEMELTEAYLAIQRIRFGQRLEVSVRIDPSALDARVPTMILQPLVENAVDHGIARRATTGHVELNADCEGERLRIVVRDDGPGLDGKALNEGVGLANTRERLEQIHGDRASLQVRSPDGGGVEAELWIPLRPS